jgi:hypothetical protein
MPFISYDIDVTRNLFTNGSVTFGATATATLGTLGHGDAVSVVQSLRHPLTLRSAPLVTLQSNYYGWGDFNAEPTPHLASCGDLYSVNASDLFEHFSIAQVRAIATSSPLHVFF